MEKKQDERLFLDTKAMAVRLTIGGGMFMHDGVISLHVRPYSGS
jgi:hypothetical protein